MVVDGAGEGGVDGGAHVEVMTRINVTVPDDLARAARERHPALNVSGVLQRALRDLLARMQPRDGGLRRLLGRRRPLDDL